MPAPQQWSGGLERDRVGDAQYEVLDDHHVGGVAPLGDRAVAVHARVGLHVACGAVLLLAVAAVVADPAGIDHRADPDLVADPMLGYI